MKILFTGKPNKGSWQIRAVQMAQGLGTCIPFATVEQCRKFDFIVAIKRLPAEVLNAIRASGKPWAWDVVDPYPQPASGTWTKSYAISWMQEQLRALAPTVAVWATQRMKDDVGKGGEVIYHHARPGMERNPIRDRIRTIGYEGSPSFLGAWSATIAKSAKRIGAQFSERPAQLASCDVVVALRGGIADCYATRHWKSNVKLANAHGSGTPFIGQPDSGYMETMSGSECWAETAFGLDAALDSLQRKSQRSIVAENFLCKTIPLSDCQKRWTKIAEQHA